MSYTIADCYDDLTTPFGEPGPYYTPGVGHRGADYRHSAGETIVAYKAMFIEYVGYSDGLGWVIGARFADGSGYAGWAHLRNIQSFLNGYVPVGGGFAEAAGRGDDPGSLWSGPHIHTTFSPISSRNAALGNLPLANPAPIIAAAIGGSASAGRPSAPIEEDDMYDANARDEVVGRMDRQIIPLLQTLVGRSRGLVAFRSDPAVEFEGKRGAGEIFIAAPGIWFHAPPAYWELAKARGVVDAPINIGWNEVPFWRDVIYLGAERNDQEILAILREQFPESAAKDAAANTSNA